MRFDALYGELTDSESRADSNCAGVLPVLPSKTIQNVTFRFPPLVSYIDMF